MLGKGEETIDQDFNRYLFRGVQPVYLCYFFSPTADSVTGHLYHEYALVSGLIP